MLTFRFSGADGRMVTAETLTSGMVGKEIKLEFSGDWADLAKTAVFTAGNVTRNVVGVSDVVVIPAEVLARPLQRLQVGIYGVSADGRVTPTIRADGPRILPGAEPSGDGGTDPDLPVWAQLDLRLKKLEEEGAGNGGQSASGADIGRIKTVLGNFMTIMTSQVEDLDGTPQGYSRDVSALVEENDALIAALGGSIDSGDGTHTHSYTATVTTAATCTAAGVRTYSCACGHSYTGQIPATGHNYVDGVCTVCGAADPDYEEEAPEILYQLANTPVTCNADLYEDTGMSYGASDATLVTKAWTICAAFTRTATSDYLAGINTSAENKSMPLGIRSNTSYYGHFPRVYWQGSVVACDVSDGTESKMVITHEAGVTNAGIKVYTADAGGLKGTATYTMSEAATNNNYAGNLFVGGAAAADFIGTIEDFTIYGRVLSEDEINAYLGVE